MKLKAVKFDENGEYYFCDFENNMTRPVVENSIFRGFMFIVYDGYLGEHDDCFHKKSYKNELASEWCDYPIYGDVYIVQLDLKEMKFVDCEDYVMDEINTYYYDLEFENNLVNGTNETKAYRKMIEDSSHPTLDYSKLNNLADLCNSNASGEDDLQQQEIQLEKYGGAFS